MKLILSARFNYLDVAGITASTQLALGGHFLSGVTILFIVATTSFFLQRNLSS